MPAIVEFPTVVAETLAEFGDLFANEPARRHFAEYLTGLFVAERKNVSAIGRQFARSTDQSCLNRWLTEADWDAEALNRRRLDWLQRDPSTRYSNRGVIALDTNRTHWEVNRVLRTYRRRWRGTECFHRDGKQHLGTRAAQRSAASQSSVGDCQLRKGRGQTRHLLMVFLAHSVLMRQLRQRRARAWALERLTTIGQACRAVARQALTRTIDWVIARVRDDGWNSRKIKAHLALM